MSNGEVPRACSLSVVLPVLDGAETLPRCLAALRGSSLRDFEIVAIDDGSSDDTAAILAAEGVDVLLRNAAPAGCFAARNHGAEAARGQVLLFVDADVEVASDTLAKVWRHCGEGTRDAVIGLYALDHPHANLASRYKNAWIRWSYLRHGSEVDWFFTAVGAVRRDVWKRVGGFAESFDRTTGGGDLDFGRKLREAGVVVLLDKTLAVVHRRRFGVWSLLVNDFNRARGWAGLGLSRLGVRGSARAGLALCLYRIEMVPVALVGAAAYLIVSRDFLVWAAANVSIGFALRCVALRRAAVPRPPRVRFRRARRAAARVGRREGGRPKHASALRQLRPHPPASAPPTPANPGESPVFVRVGVLWILPLIRRACRDVRAHPWQLRSRSLRLPVGLARQPCRRRRSGLLVRRRRSPG